MAVKIIVSSVVSKGSENGVWDRFRVINLMGIIRAETQMVREISGADRWSKENI